MPTVSAPSGAKGTASTSPLFRSAHVQLTVFAVAVFAFFLAVSSALIHWTFSGRVEQRAVVLRQEAGKPEAVLFTSMRPTPEEERQDLQDVLLLVNGSLLLLATGASWLLVGAVLRPIQEAYARQRRFLADASHELRTPLAVLRAELENESEEGSSGAASKLEEVARMSGLVSDLLELSRLDAEDAPPSGGYVDASEAVRATVARLQVFAATRKIALSAVGLAERLPVRMARAELEHALGNVVKNAIEYGEDGGSAVISGRLRKGRVELTVTDDGIGIPTADLPRVARRFARAENSRSRQTGGSGLGLAITDALVQKAGGSLDVASKEGLGTTVTLSVPAFTEPSRDRA